MEFISMSTSPFPNPPLLHNPQNSTQKSLIQSSSSSTMRTLASCYSDHAVKVSDSYCSHNKSFHSPKQLASLKNAVVSTYKVRNNVFVSIVWSNKLHCRGFWINVAKKPGSNPVRLGSEKGNEKFSACGSTVEVQWDLTKAKFSGPGPEPVSSFYVVVLIDSVPSLVLGDYGNKNNNSPRVGCSLVSQCEYFTGSTQFSTRVKFSDSGKVHEVMIRCGADVERVTMGPVLTVQIDKREVLRATGLRWNFRGNQVVYVDGATVDVMWDLNRWMNREKSTVEDDGGYDGVFIFRTRSGVNSGRLWIEEGRENETCFMVCVTKHAI